jgi:ADP-heptose:LPS heptosyltransferase
MIFFRVSCNINIKATDGSMVSYYKFRRPSELNNETAYITTYEDFLDLESVFNRIDKEKYFVKLLNEENIRSIEEFPLELGIPNKNEYLYKNNYKIDEYFFENTKVDIFQQLKKNKNDEINLVIIGGLGKTISEMIASTTALRILYNKLCEIYKSVKIDIYLNASNNSFYSRDKSIYKKLNFLNNIYPLSISVKNFTQYDYFIDTSSFIDTTYFRELNYVDAWLYKFGIDYKSVDAKLKYNELDISSLDIKKSLIDTINNARKKGKLLLYHPYSANAKKSIPQTYALSLLRDILQKNDDYVVISTLSLDSKFKDDRFIDLTKESKTLNDFMFIISQMDGILTADTATFHISDAFMIPTVAIFTIEDYEKEIKYYNFVKSIFIKDESKNLSKFIFDNEDLTFYRFESWKKLKAKQIIKLLESF